MLRPAHARGDRRGFTLVEVMMSIVVLAVGLVAACRMFSFGRLLSGAEPARIEALLLCESALERALAEDPATLRTTPSMPCAAPGTVLRLVVSEPEPGVRKVEVECRYAARPGVAAYERLATLVGEIE